MAALTAVPAMAQPVAYVSNNTARTVNDLTTDLLPGSAADELVTGLDLEAFNWTASVGVSAAARCAYDKGSHHRTFNRETKQWEGEDTIVGYHIADDKYTKGESIARACTYYSGGKLHKVTGGWFTVRLWGKVCYPTNYNICESLKGGLSSDWLRYANMNGYDATFKPGPNCGPAAWPTPELEAMFPDKGYAEWCDFTVIN